MIIITCGIKNPTTYIGFVNFEDNLLGKSEPVQYGKRFDIDVLAPNYTLYMIMTSSVKFPVADGQCPAGG